MRPDLDPIYRPPESNVERPREWDGEVGSLEGAIRGDFSLDIPEIMSEAWALTRGSKGVILAGSLVFYLVTLSVGWAMSAAIGVEAGDIALGFSIQMLGVLAGTPITADGTLVTLASSPRATCSTPTLPSRRGRKPRSRPVQPALRKLSRL